jgi:PilZ domain
MTPMRSPSDPASPSSAASGLLDETETPFQRAVDINVDVAALESAEKRQHLRFDKMFSVRVESLLFGEMYCVARNVSAGGIFLEMRDPLPLGATVRVCFPVPDGSGDVVATGEVKNHYFVNFTQGGVSKAVSGMAVRFTAFENEGHHVLTDCLSRMRVLH